MHFYLFVTVSFAVLAPPTFYVETETPGLKAQGFRFRGFCKDPADFAQHAHIRTGVRARVAADGVLGDVDDFVELIQALNAVVGGTAIDKVCIDKATEAVGVAGSIAEEMEVLDSGTRKFEMSSPLLSGLSEETQLNTGEIIGLGSRQYELIEVPEKPMADFVFPPDPRRVGVRMGDKFAKIPPFPYDRHGGKGFSREDEVDLERVNTYYNGQ